MFIGAAFYSNIPMTRVQRASGADVFQLCVQQGACPTVTVCGVHLYRKMPAATGLQTL